MRNMSFALTKTQVLNKTKDVTRRAGWNFLKVGDLLQPVEKCMGLKPGESIVRIGGPIRVLGIRREPLNDMLRDLSYGQEECAREGFGDMNPHQFIFMFCHSHDRCEPSTVITRIEFDYTVHGGGANG